jgi:hypothetical protein
MVRKRILSMLRVVFLMFLLFLLFSGCSSSGAYDVYHSENMDFGSIQIVAVLPFANLTKEGQASERVRDVFMTMLLATGGVYVIPPGEVARGAAAAGLTNQTSPSAEDVKKLANTLKADAVITGVVREYGQVSQMTSSANIISISLQMREAQGGKIVWSASSTKGGIGIKERLLGGGGQPLNDITEKAVNEIINKLFK